MTQINRRRSLSALGAIGGAAMLTGCGNERYPNPAANQNSPLVTNAAFRPPPRWQYVKLDPEAVANRAYRIYPEGGCMYAVVGSRGG